MAATAAIIFMLIPSIASAQAIGGGGASSAVTLPGGLQPPTSANNGAADNCGPGKGTQLSQPLVNLAKWADNATNQIYNTSSGVALNLAKGLGVIEVAWFIYTTVYKNGSITDVLATFTFKIISITVLLSLILTLGSDQGKLIKGTVFGFFGQLGSLVSTGNGGAFGGSVTPGISGISVSFGGGNPSPSDAVAAPLQNIAEQGTCDVYLMVQYPQEVYDSKVAHNGILDVLTNLSFQMTFLVPKAFSVIAAFGVGILFAVLDIFMVVIVIDGSLMLAAAIFLLGFSSSRWTSSLGNSYWKYVIAIGFKVFAIQFVSGIVTLFIQESVVAGIKEAGSAPALPVMATLGIVFATVIGFAMLANINKIAEAFSSGTPSFGITGAAIEGTAATMAIAGAAGAGAVAMGAGMGAAGGSIGAGRASAAGAAGSSGAGGAGVASGGAGPVINPQNQSVSPPSTSSSTQGPSASQTASAVGSPATVINTTSTSGGNGSGTTGKVGLQWAGSKNNGSAGSSSSAAAEATPSNNERTKSPVGGDNGNYASNSGSSNVSADEAEMALASYDDETATSSPSNSSSSQSGTNRANSAQEGGVDSPSVSSAQTSGNSGGGKQGSPETAFADRKKDNGGMMRRTASLVSHVFHANPMQIDTPDDAKDAGHQRNKVFASMAGSLVRGALDHKHASSFEAPKFHGKGE